MKRPKSCITSLLLIAICSGCSPALIHRDIYISDYQNGAPTYAEAKLTRAIEQELPQQNFQKSDDAVWLLLDRATTRFAIGKIDGAIADYNLAIEAMDYYSQNCALEQVGKTLLQDDFGAYPGADFEQVLARVYFALALIHKGDYSNALAILRQAEELQQQKRENYAKKPYTVGYQLTDNSVAKYLFAALLENRGDCSNAEIMYQQAVQLTGGVNLESHCTSETATVIILCHNGNVPHKISDVCDASIASAIALEIMLSSQRLPPAWSSLTGIPVPALQQKWGSRSLPTFATIDGLKRPLYRWYDVGFTADYQLRQEMPVIAARGVARFLLRRSAVACAQKQDPCLGAIVDLGMLIANANTQADTRSWTTLPNTIDLTRYDLSAGQHALTIQVDQLGCPPFLREYTLNLKPHDFCVINVFNIHPGFATVQIPQRFVSIPKCT